jgi:hypothetical protein
MAHQATMRQYLAVCGLDNGGAAPMTQSFIDSQGLSGIDDLKLLQMKDVKGMIKNHNDDPNTTRLGYIAQRNIEALVYWVRDQTRRQQPLTIAHWNDAALGEAILAMQIDDQQDDNADTPMKVSKIKTGLEWYDWKEKFENYLMMIKGVSGAPLDYVIRKEMPAGWDPVRDATNEHEKLKYQLSLTGPAFAMDTKTVYKKLRELTLGEEAYTWIKTEESSMNGRRAWLRLTDHFESEQWVGRRVNEAEKIIKDSVYTNEYTFAFERMTALLNSSYVILEKNDQPYSDRTRVKNLATAIQMPHNMDIRVAKRYMLDNYSDDWLGAINYMGNVVAELFPLTRKNTGHKRGGYNRHISESNTRARHGGGRDDGRGRGRGHGRGRFEQGRGRGRGSGNQGVSFNNVNCTDVHRTFSDDEFRAMGPEGRAYVNKERRFQRNRDNGGRFGGRNTYDGGRGNAGRYGGRDGGRGRYISEVDTRTNSGDNPHGDGDNADNDAATSMSSVSGVPSHVASNSRGATAGRSFGRGMYGRGRY